MFLLNRFFVGSLLICLQFCAKVSGRYFWVDYNGIVPDDAVLGGILGDNLTYVGQALYLDNNIGLQPVAVINGSQTVRFAHGEHVYNVSSHIKVLCSDTPIKWIGWNDDIPNKVLGGSEFNIEDYNEAEISLYVGRAVYEGQIVIGKIIDEAPTTGLIFEYEGTSQLLLLPFGVLTY